MEDTIVSVRFTELGRARRALHDLERLDEDGRLKVRGATLVQRSGQGGIDTPQAARDDDGHYLPPGGSISMVLDLLGGPLGILFARPDEDYHGHGGRSPYDGDRELALEEMSRSLEPGIMLLIAEIADPDPDVLDPALRALGGIVTRRPAREVYAEIQAAEEAENRAEEEARRVLREQRREQMERFKGTVKAKLP
jgi:hypothetical protein